MGNTNDSGRSSVDNKQTNNTNNADFSAAIQLASAYDQEGDQLLSSGNLTGALEKYNAAQKVFYSEERAKKIEKLATDGLANQLAQGLVGLAEGADRAEARMDPKGYFNWKCIGISYEKAIASSLAWNYNAYALDLNLNFLSFAGGLKFGYSTNMPVPYSIEMRNYYGQEVAIPEKFNVVREEGIFMEGSLGLNIPIGKDRPPYFAIRPMYSWVLLSGDTYFEENHDFQPADGSGFADFKIPNMQKASLAVFWQIPRTTIGLTLTLNYLMQKTESVVGNTYELEYTGSDPEYSTASGFEMKNPEKESYSQFSTGFSFIFGLPRRQW